MTSTVFDMFRNDALGSPVWIGVVGDLESARRRLSQLASAFPGEYFVFDPQSSKIIERIGRNNPNLGVWEVC